MRCDTTTHLHPVELSRLEELGRCQCAKQVALVQRLGRAMLELVDDVTLEQLLVRDTDLRGNI